MSSIIKLSEIGLAYDIAREHGQSTVAHDDKAQTVAQLRGFDSANEYADHCWTEYEGAARMVDKMIGGRPVSKRKQILACIGPHTRVHEVDVTRAAWALVGQGMTAEQADRLLQRAVERPCFPDLSCVTNMRYLAGELERSGFNVYWKDE